MTMQISTNKLTDFETPQHIDIAAADTESATRMNAQDVLGVELVNFGSSPATFNFDGLDATAGDRILLANERLFLAGNVTVVNLFSIGGTSVEVLFWR